VSDSRLRLAYFSPLPPDHSGIADYSRALLPPLAERAHLTLYAQRPDQVEASLRHTFDIRPLTAYPAGRWQHDLTLYQMGNSVYHEAMYPYLLRYPGVTVLHDYGLNHFISHRTAGQGNYAAYVREMGYALGTAGVQQAWAVYDGRQPHPLFELPLNDRVLDHSLALIVHSHYVQEQLLGQKRLNGKKRNGHEGDAREESDIARRVRLIPALMERLPAATQPADLNLPAGSILFASAGLVTATKQPELALRTFGRLRQEIPQAHFLMIGEAHEEVALTELVEKLGLQDSVTCTGFIESLEAFWGWLLAADIIVNLRHPTVGETSATALRALAAGRPVIVFDQGWYSELPDQVTRKVRPMDEEGLLAAMGQLAGSPALRQEMGQAAVQYIQTHHDPAAIAGHYIAFLQELVAHYAAGPAAHGRGRG
jgi:glycosyltransferase involved in cell wall biosynthesis